ncbi:DUF4397 domain-containing protein [Heliorestis convoluta]|uniref:DUF4397 domain-containing protein n=1 Tax=Heliorestis convoluta TaxID=356322 RepID=A0A5Q2MX79_9FIRM|nr:DUF4397 domain-containing protein [Heliorestis convoluta]QGG46401.1 hypothetical protein FTV88_0222 [Heliorestis convoluta]
MNPRLAYLRFLHASPDAPGVDIYANGVRVARNLRYQGFTQYLSAPPGRYRIRVFPAGQTTNPVVDTVITLLPQSVSTDALIGRLADIQLLPIRELRQPIRPGRLYLRFAHLSPDAPPVDLTLADGTRLFRGVGFTESTDYVELAPGTYNFQLRLVGTDDIVLRVPNITLRPDRFYTIYAVA